MSSSRSSIALVGQGCTQSSRKLARDEHRLRSVLQRARYGGDTSRTADCLLLSRLFVCRCRGIFIQGCLESCKRFSKRTGLPRLCPRRPPNRQVGRVPGVRTRIM